MSNRAMNSGIPFMLELNDKSKIIKKTICSGLQTFYPSNPGGIQEHIISLITDRF